MHAIRAKLCSLVHKRTEVEWCAGWIHYLCHRPEPQILLFRRALSTEQARLPDCVCPIAIRPCHAVPTELPSYTLESIACNCRLLSRNRKMRRSVRTSCTSTNRPSYRLLKQLHCINNSGQSVTCLPRSCRHTRKTVSANAITIWLS